MRHRDAEAQREEEKDRESRAPAWAAGQCRMSNAESTMLTVTSSMRMPGGRHGRARERVRPTAGTPRPPAFPAIDHGVSGQAGSARLTGGRHGRLRSPEGKRGLASERSAGACPNSPASPTERRLRSPKGAAGNSRGRKPPVSAPREKEPRRGGRNVPTPCAPSDGQDVSLRRADTGSCPTACSGYGIARGRACSPRILLCVSVSLCRNPSSPSGDRQLTVKRPPWNSGTHNWTTG